MPCKPGDQRDSEHQQTEQPTHRNLPKVEKTLPV